MATVPAVRQATLLLFLAVGLLGLAQIAFLPPFEGYDEPAHLSYIQQLADTATLPRAGVAHLSTDVAGYTGPLPYGITLDSSTPVSMYRSFGAASDDDGGPLHRSFQPDATANWEAQHPPLYYALMVPFYRLAHDWRWKRLLLLLRTVSWTMAFAGFVIGSRATQCVLANVGVSPPLQVLVPAWPLLMPEYFPEMARLGNDSLCLLLMGLAWSIIVRLLGAPSLQKAIWVGVVLGLGLWTKAFFIPVTVGVIALFAFAAWRKRDARYWRAAGSVAAVALVVGLPWYIYGVMAAGSLDFLQADHPGSVAALIHGFSVAAFLHGLGGIAVSFVWAGTWSFARFAPIVTLPVLVLLVLPALHWARRLRAAPPIMWAPLFIVAPVLAGLALHVLTQIVRAGEGNGTPGWYLHIFQAPLALILAAGWRRIYAPLAAYALLFHAACWTVQLSLFSGCAFKAPTEKYVQLGSCLINPAKLAALGFPMLGTAALVAGVLAAAGSLIVVARGPRLAPAAP